MYCAGLSTVLFWKIFISIIKQRQFIQPMTVFIMPAGGFFVLGCIIALVNKLANKKPPQKIGCAGCPNASACQNKGGCE